MSELERLERAGLAVWLSPALRALGIPHAFSTRHGGVSDGVFDSLNLGRAGDDGDDPDRVDENVRRFSDVALGGAPCVRVRQVHGTAVFEADASDHRNDGVRVEANRHGGDRSSADWCNGAEADAIVTASGDRAVMVRVADCAPILLACPRSGVVAAIHAGWRGVVGGVIEATLARMCLRGTDPTEVRAAIGPCIGPRAFEVGPEVSTEFERRDLVSRVLPRAGRRPTIDLAGAAADLLERAGVPRAHIDRSDLCTVELECDFFSYRRQGARSGRLAAAIASTTKEQRVHSPFPAFDS